MGKDRVSSRRPSQAVKNIKGVKIPAKLKHQDKNTVRAKKLHHHLKLIQKVALKKAKQFEVGKIKRRLKAAQDADKAKLATQLAALAEVDLDATARQAAHSCGVAQPPGEQAAAPPVVPDAGAPATSLELALRVLSARLLAAKCVREEVATAQRDLAALDAVVAAQERRQQQIAQRQADRAQRKRDAAEGTKGRATIAVERSAVGGQGLEGQAQQSSDDGDSVLGSGSASDEDAQAHVRKRQLLLGLSGSPGGERDSGRDTDRAEMSAFLPQPPAGGDGKASKAKQSAAPKKAKNRLGQRARRQLAEQAFGGSAKHLASSDQGPGNMAAQCRTPAAASPAALAAAALDPFGMSGRVPHTARAPGGAAPAEELHPSWAAKARAKAALSAKPAGKKVVFSDDGDALPPAGGSANGTAAAASHPSTSARAAPPARVPGVVRHRNRERDNIAVAVSGATGAGAKRPAGKLHPSWEAKAKLRKQMESLPAPAGTKVVFDDSD